MLLLMILPRWLAAQPVLPNHAPTPRRMVARGAGCVTKVRLQDQGGVKVDWQVRAAKHLPSMLGG